MSHLIAQTTTPSSVNRPASGGRSIKHFPAKLLASTGHQLSKTSGHAIKNNTGLPWPVY